MRGRPREWLRRAADEHSPGGQASHRHGWMMIICCVPMLVAVVALAALGVISPGFVAIAVACAVLMGLMMAGMSGGDGQS